MEQKLSPTRTRLLLALALCSLALVCCAEEDPPPLRTDARATNDTRAGDALLGDLHPEVGAPDTGPALDRSPDADASEVPDAGDAPDVAPVADSTPAPDTLAFGTCLVHCDCPQVQTCVNNKCIAGAKPTFCCDKPGCPAGQACTDFQDSPGICP